MKNGLFDLANIESMNDDDIMYMNINESAEFSHKNPDTNHPEEHFDRDGASGKETSVSVPGGDKETPSAKPADASSVTIPGGDKETPSAKPADDKSISVPSKVTLTSDQYNNALAALKKSFKEGYEIMEILENANVVNQTVEERQEAYIESLMDDILLEAYENGPIFESVTRKDKDDIKLIVKSLRDKIKDLAEDNNIKFKPTKAFLKLLFNESKTIKGSESSKYNVADNLTWWSTRFWQVVGLVYADNSDIKTVVENMNEELKDTLGDYKILYSMTTKGLFDLFRIKFGWKNRRRVYFLIVDKKISKEFKEMQNEIEKSLSNENNENNEDKKENNEE